MKQRANNQIAGFSLIEVIVGIAVLGLVTVPVCASLVLSMRLNAHSRDLMNAQLEASAVVETLMAEGIDTTDTTKYEAAGEENTYLYDGVKLTAIPVEGKNYYEVTVTGEENGQEVVLTTSIRAKGGDA